MKKYLQFMFIICVILPTLPNYACTVFYVSKNNKILVGSNNDWITTDAYILFHPEEKGKYGRIIFGFDFGLGNIEPIGGVNDHGLFFEMATVPNIKIDKDISNTTLYKGNIYEKILAECITVNEVIVLITEFNNLYYETFTQAMIGDRNGNSIIVDGDNIIKKKRSYQIMTNFRQTSEDFQNGKISCERYNIVDSMLKKSDKISIGLFKRILANTHKESRSTTIYSNIYDLRNLKLYLYFFHNYIEEIVLDIKEELKKEPRILKLATLFPQQYAAKAFMEWKNWEVENRKKSRLNKEISIDMLPDIEGKYKQTDGFEDNHFIIKVIGNKVFLISNHDREYELIPESPYKFFIPSVNGDLGFTFIKENSDEISGTVIEYELFGIKENYQKIK